MSEIDEIFGDTKVPAEIMGAIHPIDPQKALDELKVDQTKLEATVEKIKKYKKEYHTGSHCRGIRS